METRARLWAPPQRLWQHWRGDAPSAPVILGLVSSEEQCQAVPWMSGLASEDFGKCTMGVRGTPALPRYAHAYALQNQKPRLQTFRKGYEVTVYGSYEKKMTHYCFVTQLRSCQGSSLASLLQSCPIHKTSTIPEKHWNPHGTDRV